MNRHILIFLSIFYSSFIVTSTTHEKKQLKILHLSFHKGCINDFADVGSALGLDLTSWYIHNDPEYFDGKKSGNAIYNITSERANRIWNRHKNYFEQFDVIITSDTAPLSRIFLQNGWNKPLIIWICNRFDYADGDTRDGYFPDPAYYQLFNQATTMQNVKIISYTAYEHFYARRYKGIDIGTRTIKPAGLLPQNVALNFVSAIPTEVKQENALFLYPRMAPEQLKWIQNQCNSYLISTYTGGYNGPDDLGKFKAVLYFPYAWSNLALFENLQRGIIHFVPSINFVKELAGNHAPIRFFAIENLELCEWYNTEYKDIVVYFDSWKHLQRQIRDLNYDAMHKKIKTFAALHNQNILAQWQEVFNECAQILIQSI